jgi:hypothetical protein
METKRKEKLISAWIEHFSKEETEDDKTAWAHYLLSDICEKHPTLAWNLILEILRRPISEFATSVLAAGPMEDLLACHGSAVIEKVEQQARTNPAFRHLLGGVWRSRIGEAIWKRVEAVRGEPW